MTHSSMESESPKSGSVIDLLPETDISSGKKKKKKKKHRRRHPLLGLLVFILLCFGLYRLAMSDLFTLKTIEVLGNSHYTKAQVIELSGIDTGTNLFLTKTGPARELLLADPYMSNVSIIKKLPGTVIIETEERTEYACVPYGEEYVIIDGDGLVLRVTDTEPALPLLEGMTIKEMSPGKALETEETYLLTDTLELLSVVNDHDIYFKKINFSTVVVKAYINDDFYCEGTPANITGNMEALGRMVQDLYSQGITKGIVKVGKDKYLSYSPRID